jgi:HD superfamily phosphohydrolase
MAEQQENEQPVLNDWPEVVDLFIELPGKKKIALPDVSSSETLNAIRQALADFQETAFLTSFKWELKSLQDNEGNEVNKTSDVCNDFAELNAFLQPNIRTCTLRVVEDQYDVKKVKTHIKRLKDISQRTFLVSATPKDSKNKEERPESEEEVVSKNNKAAKTEKTEPLPKLEKIIKPVHLGEYSEMIFRDPVPSKTTESKVTSQPLSNVIKSAYVSGWNAPPAHRRLQGDLLYIEVSLASEGTVYLTATAR